MAQPGSPPTEAHTSPPAWARVTAPGLWLALAAGLALKLVLLLGDTVPFDGDEALVAVIARHIRLGARPVFLYGQGYMGALGSYLTALIFGALGESVLTARLLLLVEFLLIIATTYALGRRLSESRFGATAAALLVAVPPVLLVVYTTVAVGAWVEVMLLNNLIWLIGFGILAGEHDRAGWWFLLGLLAGIGWWELPIILMSIGPLALLGGVRLARQGGIPWGRVGLLAAGALLGAAPWFVGLAAWPEAVLRDTLGLRLSAALESEPSAGGLGARLLSVGLFNVPALIGLRPPWSVAWIVWPVGLVAVFMHLAAAFSAARRAVTGEGQPLARLVRGVLLLGIVLILGLMIGSPYGSDPSGRYVMVLYPPLALLLGAWLSDLRSLPSAPRWLAPLLLAGLVGYQLTGTVKAMRRVPPGLTTVLAENVQVDHRYDAALLAFLKEQGIDRGYSTYWVTFPVAFQTGEQVILAPALPYKTSLLHSLRDNKYEPYMGAALAADRVAYVTVQNPPLDAALAARLDELGVPYAVEVIGPYTAYYGLPRNVTPDELGPFGEVTGWEIYDR